LNNVIEILPRFFRPERIELNAIEPDACASGDQIERAPYTGARIDSGAGIRKLEKLPDPFCLVFYKRVIPELQARGIASHAVCSPWLCCCVW
jgi:hypothetical protein